MSSAAQKRSQRLNTAIARLAARIADIQQCPLCAERPDHAGKIATMLQALATLKHFEARLVQQVADPHHAGPLARGWAVPHEAEHALGEVETQRPRNGDQ